MVDVVCKHTSPSCFVIGDDAFVHASYFMFDIGDPICYPSASPYGHCICLTDLAHKHTHTNSELSDR